MLNKVIATTLGGALLLKEHLEAELDRLEADGKLSKTDAATLIKRLQDHGEAEEKRLRERIKESLKEVIDELGLATKADIEALKSELK